MLVGNGVTDNYIDTWSPYMMTTYNFNIAPQNIYDMWVDNDCFFSFANVIPFHNKYICYDAFYELQLHTLGLNIYDLYRPKYVDIGGLLESDGSDSSNRIGEVEVGGEIKKYKKGMTVREYTPWIKSD